MAGGFNPGARAKGLTVGTGTGAGAGVVGVEDEEDEITTGRRRRQQIFAGDEEDMLDYEDEKAGVIMTTQTLGGRIKEPVDGDPVYMLGAFRESMCDPLVPFSDLGYSTYMLTERWGFFCSSLFFFFR